MRSRMSTDNNLLSDFSINFLDFLESTKLSEARILAILQKLNLRSIALTTSNSFDTSTDWSSRLLHANLILNCLTKFKNNKQLKLCAATAANALHFYTHPTTKGGVNLQLQDSQFTYSTKALCLAVGTESYRKQAKLILDSIGQAINTCEKISDFEPNFLDVFRSAANVEISTLRDITPSQNFDNPLFFPTQKIKVALNSLYAPNHEIFPEDLPAKAFWIDWYRGIVEGKPLDWGLQLKIALLPLQKVNLENNKADLGHKIEVVYKQWELELEIKKLRGQIYKTKTNPYSVQRLHNDPPESIESEQELLNRELDTALVNIKLLEDETAKSAPDQSILARLSKWLLEASKRIAKYWVNLGDTALQSTAKWVGPAATAYAISPEGFRRLSELAAEFGKLISGG